MVRIMFVRVPEAHGVASAPLGELSVGCMGVVPWVLELRPWQCLPLEESTLLREGKRISLSDAHAPL